MNVQDWLDHSEIAQSTGLVIPAYFSAKPSDDMVRHLLWMTLTDCPACLRWDHVWVVVDGDERTAGLAEALGEELKRRDGSTFHLLALPRNGGKLWAIRQGMAALLASATELAYLAVRDGDGDHIVDDLPALVRTAASLAAAYGHEKIIVAGSRRSRIHPMGWMRGELEALLDRVTVDALAYHLAGEGRAMNLSHLRSDGAPDLSSGFKVYGREIAQHLFVDAEPALACLSPEDYWHYGPETVKAVEAALCGAVIAETPRLTWDGQPTTSFGEFRYVALYGELLAWLYVRLNIPMQVAAQFYDNHLPAMSLRTTTEGREMLGAVREHALRRVAAHRGDSCPIPPEGPVLAFL